MLLGKTFADQFKDVSSQLQIIILSHFLVLNLYRHLRNKFFRYRRRACWCLIPQFVSELGFDQGVVVCNYWYLDKWFERALVWGWIRKSRCFLHILSRSLLTPILFIVNFKLPVLFSRRLSLRLIIGGHLPFQRLFVWFIFSHLLNSFI